MLVSQLIRLFRANRVIGVAMILFAGLCCVYILMEFFSGGTLKKAGRFIRHAIQFISISKNTGNWNPYLVFPIYVSIGACLGVMELIRFASFPFFFFSFFFLGRKYLFVFLGE